MIVGNEHVSFSTSHLLWIDKKVAEYWKYYIIQIFYSWQLLSKGHCMHMLL